MASVFLNMRFAPPPTRDGWRWQVFELAVGVAAAVPSIAGALLGTPLAVDDWWFAAKARYVDFASAFGQQIRSRPIEGLWNWGEFRLLGTHPLPHLLVLAAVNAAAAILFWQLLIRWVPRRVAVLTTLVWIALPNRGSTHLWSTNSPHMFSLVMLLGALRVASTRPLGGRRLAVAVTLLAVGTLAYEGAIALGVVGLGAEIVLLAPRRHRIRWAVSMVVVMAVVGISVLVNSPKRSGPVPVFHNLSHLPSAHFGPHVLPSTLLAFVVLIAIAWCVVTVALPGFDAMLEQRLVVIGLVMIVLGALPFTFGGFPFSTSGFFDRGNTFSDLGTSLVYGSLIALLLRLRWRVLGAALAGAALVAIAVPNVGSIEDYLNAARDGRRFLGAIDALPVDIRTRGPVTFAPLPGHHAVAEFLYDYDISSALAVRYRTGEPFPRAVMAASAAAFARARGPKYQLVGNRLIPR